MIFLYVEDLIIETNFKEEIIVLDEKVKSFLEKTKVKDGLLIVNSLHTTFSIILNENEKNLKEDIINVLSFLDNFEYEHDNIDDNASSHIKNILLGNNIVIPIINNKLSLGTWQSILGIELDGPKNRRVRLTIIEG